MMIDFSKIVELVPDGGRLVLTFTTKTNKTKSGDEMAKEISVVFAQQFKGKENDNDFSPIIVTGDIAELSQSFESTVIDIAGDQKRLAELKATTISRVDQKKKQLSDAIQKHTKTPGKSDPKNGEEEKKTDLKEEKPKPYMSDLFSMSPARPAAPETVATAAPASEQEASQSNAAPEVDHE